MIPTDLYTAEGADSARQSAKDKTIPDPTPEQANAAIDANTVADLAYFENLPEGFVKNGDAKR